jgi:hypothetical protein
MYLLKNVHKYFLAKIHYQRIHHLLHYDRSYLLFHIIHYNNVKKNLGSID